MIPHYILSHFLKFYLEIIFFMGKQRKKSSLPMTALFQKEKVFLIGITDLPQCENIGEFSQTHYSTWDKKCLSQIDKIFN